MYYVQAGYKYFCPVSLEATESDKSGLEESIIRATTQARVGVWIRPSKDVATNEAGQMWSKLVLVHIIRALGRNAWLWAGSVPRPPLSTSDSDRGSLLFAEEVSIF
jgi:hypothetical protein